MSPANARRHKGVRAVSCQQKAGLSPLQGREALWASWVAQLLRLSVQEMWVRSLVWGDPLEKAMAAHSSILAGRIPWTEEPGGL